MPALKIVLFVLLGLIVSILAVKNLEMVELHYYDFALNSGSFKAPLLIVIMMSVVFGFLLAWVYGWVSELKLKSVIRFQNKTIEQLEADIEKMKVPILPETTEPHDFTERN